MFSNQNHIIPQDPDEAILTASQRLKSQPTWGNPVREAKQVLGQKPVHLLQFPRIGLRDPKAPPLRDS